MGSRDEDKVLVARCLAGDPAAWETLWEACRPYLAAALRSWASGRSRRLDPSRVEDLCQDLFVRLWEDRQRVLGEFQGRSSLRHYLAVIAIHRAMRSPPPIASLSADQPDRGPAPGQGLEIQEQGALLKESFASLPPRERLLVRLV